MFEECIRIIKNKIRELEDRTKLLLPEREVWAARYAIDELKEVKSEIEQEYTRQEKNKLEEEMREEGV